MKSLKMFSRFINFSPNRSVCILVNMVSHSNYRHSYVVRTNVKSYMTVVKNDNLNLQKCTPISNTLLTRNISLSMCYAAKSKDRGGKEKKKPKAAKLDLRELADICDVDDLTSKMTQSIENMKVNFMKNLTLRSTSGALEQIPVKVEGKEYQLQELAQIARKPKIIVLNVASFPTAIPLIMKAIEKSGLNINPQQDGTTIFLPIPKVTKEHRENLSKNAKAIFIKHRDEIKDIRNKAIKNIKKKTDISTDVVRRVEAQVEALCDKYLKEAELVLETKQNELLRSTD